MAAAIDPIKQILQEIYRELVGVTFRGTYKGSFEMLQTPNERHIIAVESSSPLSTTLTQISNSVLALCQKTTVNSAQVHPSQVWKGVTGPMDGYTDYWLWVEPDLGGVNLQEDVPYDFKIEKCTAFQCKDSSFLYGVSIKASTVVPAIMPVVPVNMTLTI